jgi:hypothetical protein
MSVIHEKSLARFPCSDHQSLRFGFGRPQEPGWIGHSQFLYHSKHLVAGCLSLPGKPTLNDRTRSSPAFETTDLSRLRLGKGVVYCVKSPLHNVRRRSASILDGEANAVNGHTPIIRECLDVILVQLKTIPARLMLLRRIDE